MKNLILCTASLVFSSSFAFAQDSVARINSLNCTAQASNGTTVVNNVMTAANGSYVTISNFPTFGFPFVQQAKIIDGENNGQNFDIKLHTMLTNQTLTLRLKNQSTKGLLFGANGNALVMTCQASISR